MSSRSLMSSPTRTIGWPHSGVGQRVSSGSMRWSTRGRWAGSASRLGWRRGCLSGCPNAWGVGCGGALQGLELGLQAGLVGGECLLEDLTLLGVHALGLGAELPVLQPRQLEGDALDLRVTPLDGLRLRVDPLVLLADVSALLADVGQHLRGECGQLGGAQDLEVLGFDRLHIEHAAIVQTSASSPHRVFFQLN